MNTRPLRHFKHPNLRKLTARERARAIALDRLQVVHRFQALRREGVGIMAAAEQIGVAPTTCWKWQRRFESDGLEALAPKYHKCGPRSPLSRFELSHRLVSRVQRLCVALGSNTRAWRHFAQSTDCPSELAAVLKARRNVPARLLHQTKLTRRTVTILEGGDFAFIAPALDPKPA